MTRPRIQNVDPRSPDPAAIGEAAALLAAGGLVVLPTETVYGLVADPRNPSAMRRLFEAKGRDAAKPVAWLVAGGTDWAAVGAAMPDAARRLAARWWPGPLTLVLECAGGTQGFRWPDHAVPLAVIRRLGRPLAATSANRSGDPDARTAAVAAAALGAHADLILDGGPVTGGTPSTVVRAVGGRIEVLREGAIRTPDIMAVASASAPAAAAMWDQRYASADYAYGTEPNGFVASVAPRIPPGPVLCLAEGEGRNAVYLAGRGHDVTMVDVSAAGLRKAEALAAARGVRIRTVLADLADYTIESSAWQGIISVFAHVDPALRARVHAASVRGLAPGGVFVLEGYAPRQLEFRTGGPPLREMLMDLADLRRELAGLELEIAREVERDIVEGRFHTGRGAVVQVLARKPSAASA